MKSLLMVHALALAPTVTKLSRVQALAAALQAEMSSFQQKLQAREEAMQLAQQVLQQEGETTRDECDELRRLLRISERQLARLRKPKVLPWLLVPSPVHLVPSASISNG